MSAGVWKLRAIAERDIDEISTYIAGDNLEAALRFLDVVRDAFEVLASFPKAGQARQTQSHALAGLRSWPLGGRFSNYLVLYFERDFGVEILRVIQGQRDVARILDELT